MENLVLPDGRSLEYFVVGPAGGRPLVFHGGTPTAAVEYRPFVEAAARHGLRFVTSSRPGYGTSTPQPGRRVADVAADVAALLDAIGADEFLTFGWSGGGPHTLACAALLSGRCRGAGVIAGVAPYDADGIDWLAGMGEENLAEFGAAVQGAEALTAALAKDGEALATVRADQVAAGFGDLVSDVDRRALTGELAEYVAAAARRSVSSGVRGWVDDDLAFTSDWGFGPADVRVPVSLWQGDQDRMVPYDHGRWLAARLPEVSTHLIPGEGHISMLNRIDEIIDDLVEKS